MISIIKKNLFNFSSLKGFLDLRSGKKKNIKIIEKKNTI
jgi:hypothetical protein